MARRFGPGRKDVPSRREQIAEAAIKLLEQSADGCMFSELRRKLGSLLPDIRAGTLMRGITDLARDDRVLRPEVGRYVLNPSWVPPPAPDTLEQRVPEWRFYRSFADFLGELEGCSRCIVVGGSRLRDRWSTPDVVGRVSAAPGSIVPWSDMLVSGELKIERDDVFRGFGQACAYRLFSHVSYLAVPRDCRAEDLRRLELLCVRSSVGLVLYDARAPEDPRWMLRHRPAPLPPDMALLNEKLALLKAELYD